MTNKNCPVCGQQPSKLDGFPDHVWCKNKGCMFYHVPFKVSHWNAPRPVEDALRAELEATKALHARIYSMTLSDSKAVEAALTERDEARAELSKYKPPEGRRCETCESFGTRDGPDDYFCYFVHNSTSKDGYCGWWEG